MKNELFDEKIQADVLKITKWLNANKLKLNISKVTIAGVSSNFLNMNCGVPLGPLLFLIYINDLPNVCSQVDVYLFADDTNI